MIPRSISGPRGQTCPIVKSSSASHVHSHSSLSPFESASSSSSIAGNDASSVEVVLKEEEVVVKEEVEEGSQRSRKSLRSRTEESLA